MFSLHEYESFVLACMPASQVKHLPWQGKPHASSMSNFTISPYTDMLHVCCLVWDTEKYNNLYMFAVHIEYQKLSCKWLYLHVLNNVINMIMCDPFLLYSTLKGGIFPKYFIISPLLYNLSQKSLYLSSVKNYLFPNDTVFVTPQPHVPNMTLFVPDKIINIT